MHCIQAFKIELFHLSSLPLEVGLALWSLVTTKVRSYSFQETELYFP